MLTMASAFMATACVVASARRLAWAVLPTWFDPQLLLFALRGGRREDLSRLRDAIATCDGATWELNLLAALAVADERSRIALVNEQLRELDWRAHRWASVPRVSGRVATSAGFLIACIALIRGLTLSTGDVSAALMSALDALSVGIAGMSFCYAVHLRAQRALAERLAATERMVERLEALASAT
jgi:predicted nucleic acid-binding protein